MSLTTMLFAPADDPRKLAGLAASGADAVVADLEDAVAASRKAEARATAAQFLRELPTGCPPLWCRIGGVELDIAALDVAAIDHPNIAGIVVPKVEDLSSLDGLNELLETTTHLGGARLVPQIETARGLLLTERLESWPTNVVTLSFGSVDFARDLGVEFDPRHPAIDSARRRLLVAAIGTGLTPPIDGPWMKVRDLDGLRHDTELGRTLGMSGKSAIHPAQVAVIQTVHAELAPSRKTHLERVIETYEANPDSAALVVDDVFVDEPVYRAALATLGRSGRR